MICQLLRSNNSLHVSQLVSPDWNSTGRDSNTKTNTDTDSQIQIVEKQQQPKPSCFTTSFSGRDSNTKTGQAASYKPHLHISNRDSRNTRFSATNASIERLNYGNFIVWILSWKDKLMNDVLGKVLFLKSRGLDRQGPDFKLTELWSYFDFGLRRRAAFLG